MGTAIASSLQADLICILPFRLEHTRSNFFAQVTHPATASRFLSNVLFELRRHLPQFGRCCEDSTWSYSFPLALSHSRAGLSTVPPQAAWTSVKFLLAPGSSGFPRRVQNLHHLHVQPRRKRLFDLFIMADPIHKIRNEIARRPLRCAERYRFAFRPYLPSVSVSRPIEQSVPSREQAPLWAKYLHLSHTVRPIP